jgi:hypothetical protein
VTKSNSEEEMMKNKLYISLLMLVGVMTFLIHAAPAANEHVDRIYINGKIWTADSNLNGDFGCGNTA